MFKRLIILCLIAIIAASAQAEDWPTHLHDNQRSGVTSEQLKLPLQQEWVYNSPSIASAGAETPALQNFYGSTNYHKTRLPIDNAFQIVVADGGMFFGTAIGDKLVCLNTWDGSERWKFFANGPIRFAPTVNSGKVYFGSDDGYVYCLNGINGNLIWKKRAAASDNLMFIDGRMVSVSPVRTSVLVDNGVAYWGAGILSGAQTGLNRYLCAYNAENGTEEWTVTPPRPLQGHPMASAERLYMPSGKSQPIYYQRSNGGYLGTIGNSRQGGSYALLSDDNKLFFGPHYSSTGSYIGKYDAVTGNAESVAWGPGNYLVVTADYSYYSTDTSIIKINRTNQTTVWQVTNPYPYQLIMAGQTLFVGGDDEVAALSSDDGSLLWKASVNGRVRSLAVADRSLYVSTDQGAIHCFKPWNTTVNLDDYCFMAMDWMRDPVISSGDFTTDGIVDFSDLSMLLACWVTRIQPGIVGFWQMDENSGSVAHDISGKNNNADLINSPTWQPAAGHINGALQLNGVNQYVDAPFLLNPANGPFTTCAWVKGGQPNEKIICQTDGTGIGRNWLNTESTGYLGTNVRIPSGSNLTSTYSGHLDGYWHHVALTWDGARRRLYADGAEVAADPADLGAALESCDGRLFIGAHKSLAPDLYWTGLIDDVRIYHRALLSTEILEQAN